MRKVVYSVLFGDYDSIKDPIYINPDWEYILFTDQPVTSDYWNIIQMQGNRMAGREIKICPHRFFEFEVAVYIDASMTLQGNPEVLAGNLTGEKPFLFKLHPHRTDIEQEAQACKLQNKGEPKEIDAQLKEYAKEGFNANQMGLDQIPLIETGFHARLNTMQSRTFADRWFKELTRHTHRDQLSLPYVVWKYKQGLTVFGHDIYIKMVALSAHKKGKYIGPRINYLTPYTINGNLGGEYNRAISAAPQGEWVAIQDGDSMFINSEYGKRIAQTIHKNKKFDIFVPMTNRLRDYMQLFEARLNDDSDLTHHSLIGEHLWLTKGTKVREADRPAAGLFVLAKKETFEKIKFKNGLIWIDTDFFIRAKQAGLKVGIMEGIYLFHYYRLKEGINHVNHLKSV